MVVPKHIVMRCQNDRGCTADGDISWTRKWLMVVLGPAEHDVYRVPFLTILPRYDIVIYLIRNEEV